MTWYGIPPYVCVAASSRCYSGLIMYGHSSLRDWARYCPCRPRVSARGRPKLLRICCEGCTVSRASGNCAGITRHAYGSTMLGDFQGPGQSVGEHTNTNAHTYNLSLSLSLCRSPESRCHLISRQTTDSTTLTDQKEQAMTIATFASCHCWCGWASSLDLELELDLSPRRALLAGNHHPAG